jgi:site-specific recombinase XerD
VALATVRTLGLTRKLRTDQDAEDFEQELVDQFALAAIGAGTTDRYVATERSTIFAFARFLDAPLWTAGSADADRFLGHLRRERRQARSTIESKVGTLARFYDFLIARYQGDVHALTGYVLVQPIDEYNRPAKTGQYGNPRIPPEAAEIEHLFTCWRDSLPEARKYMPAARDYFAASLWRRAGLRITETVMLDVRDWRPDIGAHGKLHVRFGKGSRGRGPKARMVSAIDSVDALLEWWLADVRHQFGADCDDLDAPLLPSERLDRDYGTCLRIQPNALRDGLAAAVARWLPDWTGRLTPHVLRHYCASSLYQRGLDLKAIQEQLGHEWLSTTTRYIHVHDEHIEQAWASAHARVTDRLTAR